ncbi:phytoene synthase [Natronomonas pharaonis DSM 2160]|uniref:Phytoene synthase n=1 Tax=Natronomonas pharaonis (strain ATCC 35678 / DSM 2160 / CIP 103997 / JCM 8858 / NBRC 14720 / NCIMB 2260 / Gabara) TaxID=348780 RepID=A0A1U7EZ05_NATPD|nr:phytoene/squalene synthase family protein [Natronomonas pharaonis]CAI50476.1 phytoene synthase [Natronomonas pharaonis DSM 2160]
MVDSTQLAESKSIHRETGKTFYYATRLLPERVRHPTYVLYAFFRLADEVVDDPGALSPDEQRQELLDIREAALGRTEPDDPVLEAFSEVRRRHDIPDEEVEVFIDAMLTDIEKSRYETYEELEAYMQGSASAVGVMMTMLMGTEDTDAAVPRARALGEAFQLTNFLRDIGEDIEERNRIYLPQETLDAYDVDPADIEAHRFTDELGDAIEHELERAERRYREGVAGIKYLPVDCQLPVLTAAVLYADHHRLIRDHDLDTVTQTPSLGTLRKLALVARTRWHWAWTKDPEAVFSRVSPISMGEETAIPSERPRDPLPMG